MHIIVLPNIRNISEIQFLGQIFHVLGSLEAHPERCDIFTFLVVVNLMINLK